MMNLANVSDPFRSTGRPEAVAAGSFTSSRHQVVSDLGHGMRGFSRYEGIKNGVHQAHALFHKNLEFCENAREVGRVTFAGNSLGGHALIAAGAISDLPKAASIVMGGSSVFGAVIGVPIGLAALRDSALRVHTFCQANDPSSALHSTLWGIHGAGLAAVSSLVATRGIMNFAQIAAPAAFLPAIVGFGAAASLGAAGYAGYGAHEAMRFRKAFHLAQKEGLRGALEFLDRQVNLLPEEIDGKSDDQIAQALQKKWNCLERKLGKSCAQQIREELPLLMADFDPVKAEQLIKTVDRENFKIQMRYMTLLCAGIIGIFAFLTLLLTSYPILAAVLCMIGSLMMITVDTSILHNWIGEKLWAWHHPEKPEIQPCQTPIAS